MCVYIYIYTQFSHCDAAQRDAERSHDTIEMPKVSASLHRCCRFVSNQTNIIFVHCLSSVNICVAVFNSNKPYHIRYYYSNSYY